MLYMPQKIEMEKKLKSCGGAHKIMSGYQTLDIELFTQMEPSFAFICL